MEIIIHDKNAFQHTLDERSNLWRMQFKKYIKAYLIQCSLGVFLLGIGLPLNTSVSETTYVNNITHQNETTYQRYPVNFVGAFGIAYVFWSTISLIKVRVRKKTFFSETERMARLIFNQVNESILTINDKGIVYQTPATRSDCNWNILSHFSLYKDYLLLNIDQSGHQGFTVNRHLISEKEFQDLVIFVRQKLTQKKG